MKMDSVIEKDFKVVHPEMDLGQMIGAISNSKRNIFPVTNANGDFLGMVLMDNIRNIMFRQELYHHFKVERLMTSPPARLYDTDSMEQVMEKFDETEAWNLPVINEEGKYLGFVSKSKVFNAYREMMVHLSEE